MVKKNSDLLSNKLLEKMIRANIIGVTITDANGAIIKANDYFLKMLGMTRKELEKGTVTWQKITPEKYIKSSHNRIKELHTKGQVGPFFKEYITKKGKTVPVMIGITLLDKVAKQEVAYVLDLTQQKRIEKEADTRISILLNNASDAFFSYDKKWNFAFINKKAESLIGIPKKDLLGKNIWELFPESKKTETFKKYHEAVKKQTPLTFEEQYTQTGKWYEYHLYPHKSGLFAYIQDITDRKNAEETNAKLASIVTFSEDAIIGKTLEGIITSWNKGAEKMYGYTEDEVIGKSITILFPPDKSNEFDTIMSFIKKGQSLDHYETTRIKKNGERINVSATISPIKNHQKKIIGVSAIARDITETKKTQEQLQFHASVAQSISDAVITTDTHYNVVSWNKAATELYGWTEAEMLSKQISPVLKTSFSGNKKVEWSKEILEKGYWKGEIIQSHKDGHLVTVLASVSVVKNRDGQIIGYVSINRDITERKRVEDNLRFLANASKFLSSSLDYKTTLKSVVKLAVPHIADWCSVEMLTGDGNAEQLAIAHKDPEKIKWAKELTREFPRDKNAPTGLPNVLRTGKSELYPIITDEMIGAVAKNQRELVLIRSIGLTSLMVVPIISRKKVLGAIQFVNTETKNYFTHLDLTMAEELANRAALAIENAQLYEAAQTELKERIKAEAVVQESEERFRRLYDSNLIGIAFWNTEGVTTKANSEYLRILGLTQKDLEAGSMHWEDITPSEYKTFDDTAMQHALEYGVSQIYEKEYIRKDGSRIPVLIGIALMQNSQKEGVAFVLDITERKQMEQRKDEFISIASHELKTPLTSIKGYTQILERYIKNDFDIKAKAYLQKTNIYIDRLNSLITDLLDVSKIQAGKLLFNMVEFNFEEMIKDSIDSIQPTATHHKIILEGEINEAVIGDKDRLEQVVTNLLSNAIKYSPKAKKVIVHLKKEKEQIQVSVTDFGIGIAHDQLSKIFNRFYRVESIEKNFSGLGIGLYISCEIIKRHHGKMWVESKEGKGSTFFFTIPKTITKNEHR